MANITAIRNPEHYASDAAASRAGYTRHVLASGNGYLGDVAMLIKPDTELDGMFTAFDTDAQEWVIVAGFNLDFEDAE